VPEGGKDVPWRNFSEFLRMTQFTLEAFLEGCVGDETITNERHIELMGDYRGGVPREGEEIIDYLLRNLRETQIVDREVALRTDDNEKRETLIRAFKGIKERKGEPFLVYDAVNLHTGSLTPSQKYKAREVFFRDESLKTGAVSRVNLVYREVSVQYEYDFEASMGLGKNKPGEGFFFWRIGTRNPDARFGKAMGRLARQVAVIEELRGHAQSKDVSRQYGTEFVIFSPKK
jgi:hypothetical protein